MSSKIVLILISLLSTGFVAMPQALTLFAGEHYWYNLSSYQTEVPCEKCHADIAEEMSVLISAHTGESNGERFRCEYCHRVFLIDNTIYQMYRNMNTSIEEAYTYEYAKANSAEHVPGKDAHAASTVPCLYCHSGQFNKIVHGSYAENCYCHGDNDGGSDYYYHGDRFFTGSPNTDVDDECSNCHANRVIGLVRSIVDPVPAAGGFGWTTNESDSGVNEAHMSFINNAIKTKTLEHCNEACIACHTAVPVKLNITRLRSVEFEVGLEEQLTARYGIHNYSVDNWEYNGSGEITVWGNMTGEGSITCDDSKWPGEI